MSDAKVYKFLRDDSGAIATEYFLIAVAFSLTVCAGVNAIVDVVILF